MPNHEIFMRRCFELAQQGEAHASPNPMVGSVVVHKGRIIGEGFHRKAGEAHAEVNAIASVKDKGLLRDSTIYVSLEPCSHFGKTPPCSDLIIESKIPRVVVSVVDPFAKVNGAGIQKLKSAGIDVTVGVLEAEGLELNKRFFKFHSGSRPFVTLKWAETQDGYLDHVRDHRNTKALKVTGHATKQFTHKLRATHDAILIGYNTALLDNPKLDNRLFSGSNPVRMIVDLQGQLPVDLQVFTDGRPTVVFCQKRRIDLPGIEQIMVETDWMGTVFEYCKSKLLLSLFVEGGAATINAFIQSKHWDEAYRYIGPTSIQQGVDAPSMVDFSPINSGYIDEDSVLFYKNTFQ